MSVSELFANPEVAKESLKAEPVFHGQQMASCGFRPDYVRQLDPSLIFETRYALAPKLL